MGSSDLLVLDSQIRDWVLIPIVVVMFLIAILRHNITMLLRTTERKIDLKSVKEAQILLRVKRLKTNANKISLSSFRMRKYFFNDKETGVFRDRGSSPTNPLANPMMDPTVMVDMMKKNMAMIIPQILPMAWVNYFFSGFVLVKLPFPLTLAFKSMLQRGIDLTTLDITYVSSLSWYFLTLFGLRGLNSVALGDTNVVDDAQLMQEQMQAGMGAGTMGAPDINKVYQAEKENLELVKHEWELENVEERLMGKSSSQLIKGNKFENSEKIRSVGHKNRTEKKKVTNNK